MTPVRVGWGVPVGEVHWHPPILLAQWHSNGRLHLQTAANYHSTTQPTLTQSPLNSTSTSPPTANHKHPALPTPPSCSFLLAEETAPPVSIWFPAQVTYGMFHPRGIQMCATEKSGRKRRASLSLRIVFFVHRRNVHNLFDLEAMYGCIWMHIFIYYGNHIEWMSLWKKITVQQMAIEHFLQ